MTNDWILDVLADLKAFARKNGLPVLASHLDDATLVAAAELATVGKRAPARRQGDAGHAGRVLRPDGNCHDAG